MHFKLKLFGLFITTSLLSYGLILVIRHMDKIWLELRDDFEAKDIIEAFQDKFIFSGSWTDKSGKLTETIK